MSTPNKSELDRVRDYADAVGVVIRSTPIESMSEHEKMLILENLLNEIQGLAAALNVEMGFRPLFVCKKSDVNPPEALRGLSEILHQTFIAYHRLGLAGCASEGFKELHESKMSRHTEEGYFSANMKGIINSSQPKPFLVQDPEG